MSPTYGLYPGRMMIGTCGGGLRAMRKGRKDRGKSGDQPHNLGENWERGQPSGQGPALRLKWPCIGTCVCACV